MSDIQNQDQVFALLSKAKAIAAEYYKLTGKPLGITGEIGEYLAAVHLELKLAPAREAGFDAWDKSGAKIHITSRSVRSNKKAASQKLGSIRLDKNWDSVLLVLMNEHFELVSMHQAERQDVSKALLMPGSKARNERGALSISKFRTISKTIWQTQ